MSRACAAQLVLSGITLTPITRNGKLPTEPKGFRAEPWKREATAVNKNQGHCLFHTTTELQLSKEAAATPEGHPTGCHTTHRSAACVTGWRQLRFHDIGTNWDLWKVCTPMFCRFPGLKQLQLNTSFFPSSEKHLLLVAKGLGMAYCVIAQMTENKFKYKKCAGLFFCVL